MNLSEVTSVPLEELPLQAYRDHLRLGRGFDDDSLQDAVLESTLLAAISAIEIRTGKALLTRQFQCDVSRWSAVSFQSLPRGPIQAVDNVALHLRDGSVVPLPEDTYHVLEDGFRPGLEATTIFPQIPSGARAEILFQAGYGPTWSAVPESLSQAVLILAAHFYETRDGTQSGTLPTLVRNLIDVFRDIRVFGGVRR